VSKKIILFLSELKPNASEEEYICPDGQSVSGMQTNEAPVKYLLRSHPDTSEIICIVTTKAWKTAAWEQFQQKIAAENDKVLLTQIPFVDGQDFTRGPLAKIMSDTTGGDEILLETTGGPRDAVMHLLLLSRVLSYAGVKTVGAVYSNFQERQIEDVSHLISLFDLVGGMQEMTSFGSVRTLRNYYAGQPKDEAVENLLSAVERLTECITLCQTNRINEAMSEFNQALTDAEQCSDPMMRVLLPAFREKFGEELTIPGLINWCVESDMLQQALTIYKERVPAYLLTDIGALQVKPTFRSQVMEKLECREYQSEDEAIFCGFFLSIGNLARQDDSERSDILTMDHLGECMAQPGCYFQTSHSTIDLCKIVQDYQYIRAMRNMICHANDQATEGQRELLEYLKKRGGYVYDPVSAVAVKETIKQSLKRLEKLAQATKKRRRK
jgi:hypothetical protein